MDAPRAIRTLLVIAAVLGLATATLVARPPNTPPPTRRTEGFSGWWWGSRNVEEALYRAPQPAPWRGPGRWQALPSSQIEVVARTSELQELETWRGPLTGEVTFDTRDLNHLTGGVRFEPSALRCGHRGKDAAFAEAFASSDQVEIRLRGAQMGTAPRHEGAEVEGLVTAGLEGQQQEVATTLTRKATGFQLLTIAPIGWEPLAGDARSALLVDLGGSETGSYDFGVTIRMDLVQASD